MGGGSSNARPPPKREKSLDLTTQLSSGNTRLELGPRQCQEDQDLLEQVLNQLQSSPLDDASTIVVSREQKRALTALLGRVKLKAINNSRARVQEDGDMDFHPEFLSPEDYVHRGKSMGLLESWGDDVMLSLKVKHLGLVWIDRGVGGNGDATSREPSIAGSDQSPIRARGSGISSIPSISMSVASSPVLEMQIKMLDSWSSFDVFEVDRLCGGLPLQVVSLNAFARLNTISRFSLPEDKLRAFLADVENHYSKEIPYHTSVHVSDVVQGVVCALYADAGWRSLTDLEVLALIFAATIHDLAHPGVNNPFLIRTGEERAIIYNDRSVLENGHCSLGFRLLRKPENNFLAGLSQEDGDFVRKLVIELILATDMTMHSSLVADVEATALRLGGEVAQWKGPDRILLLKYLLHSCDISNPGRPFDHCYEWGRRVTDEFFRQGDREKEMGVPVNPINDRHTATPIKGQKFFCEFFVKPTFAALLPVAPNFAKEVLDHCDANAASYAKMIEDGIHNFDGL